MSRSLLLVAYSFPPSTNTGAHRPAAMAKYLARAGHRVTVLTTAAYGEGPAPDGVEISRAFDLQLLRARRAGQDRVLGSFDQDIHPSERGTGAGLLVPEPLVLVWAPFALARALRLRHGIDCVITTSPPESAHLVGWTLRRLGVPWVADIRDAWNFESMRPPWPTGVQRRVDHWLERRSLRAADVAIGVTDPVVEDLRERLGARAALVPNGWDPELLGAGAAGSDGTGFELDPDRITVVYTGRFATGGRDPAGLIEALREIGASEPQLARRLELVFAGPYKQDELERLGRDYGEIRVRVLGTLSRERALALQRAGDALLLLSSTVRRQVANYKLYEYLSAGKPILALSGGTEAGRIVEQAGAGVVVDAADPGAIREAMRKLVAGEVPAPPEGSSSAYTYPRIAELMEAQIEAAISRARGG